MSISDGKLDSLLVLYSSQTGTAESIGELMVNEELSTLCHNPRLFNVSAYIKEDKDLSLFAKEQFVLFIVSTTGDGDLPDSSLPFMRVVRRMDKKLSSERPVDPSQLPFHGVKILNLGLGDSNYNKFNAAIATLDKHLVSLGCEKVNKTVLADDGIGLEVGVEQWRDQVKDFFAKYIADPLSITAKPTVPTENKSSENIEGMVVPISIPAVPVFSTDKTVFLAPDLSVAPPAATAKPQLLIKRQDYRIEAHLTTPTSFTSVMNSIISPENIITIDHVIDVIKLSQVGENHELFTTPYFALPGADGDVLYSSSSLLLSQYAATHNLHTFINSVNTHSEQKNAVMRKLYAHEYGYSNLNNNPPLFGALAGIYYPIDNRTGELGAEIKDVVEIDLKLDKSCIRALSAIKNAVPAEVEESNSNPVLELTQSVTVDRIASLSQQDLTVVSLYRPGDSVSIICPNAYTTVNTVLSSMGNTYSGKLTSHSVLITQKSPESDTCTPHKPSYNHDFIQQPSIDLVNVILSQKTQTNDDIVKTDDNIMKIAKNILSVGNVLLDAHIADDNNDQQCFASILPSLRDIIEYSTDLTSPIKKSIIRAIADHCAPFISQSVENDVALYTAFTTYQQHVVELLYEFMSRDGKNKLKQFIEDKSLTLCEFISLFSYTCESSGKTITLPALQPTLQMLLELCGSLKPRSYSISTSPYKYLVDQVNGIEYNLDRTDDITALYTNVENCEQSDIYPTERSNTFIAGQYIRFAASITTSVLPTLEHIPAAQYKEALPYNSKSIQSSNPSAFTTLPETSANRIYNGLCTHWFADICRDFEELAALSGQHVGDDENLSKTHFKCDPKVFTTFLNSKKYDPSTPGSSPYRFYGCIIKYNPNSQIASVFLPFFFHTSPTFHPPSVIQSLIKLPTKSDEIDQNMKINNNDVLLFGPGTGSSPFLSFIEHKLYESILKKSNNTEHLLPSYWASPLHHYETQIHAENVLAFTTDESLRAINRAKLSDAYNGNIIAVEKQQSTLSLKNNSSSLNNTETENQNSCSSNITLYTGNRYRNKDFLYSCHWFNHLSTTQGSLNDLHSVFSRESTPNPENNVIAPKYVQDLIIQHSYGIAKHIFSGGFIYVCGDGAVMSKQLQKVIETAVSTHCLNEELYSLYSLCHDINTNTSVCKWNPNETVSPQLITYVSKNPKDMLSQIERDAWARGVVAIMIKSGRYNTDVW